MCGKPLVLNLDGMSTLKATEHPDAGKRIRARRAFLGLSRPDLTKASEGVLYERLQKRIEDGDKRVRTLRVHQISAYLAVLDWSAEDFERETGVDLPDSAEAVPGSEPFVGGLSVGYYGTIRAGLGRVEQEDDPERKVALDPIMPGVRGRDERRLGLLRVNGDSMVSERAAESIPEGSMVLVEWGAAPAPDEIVVAWLRGYDTAVLKQYKEGPETVLRSFNPAGPVFRTEAEAEIRGVVRMVMRKP